MSELGQRMFVFVSELQREITGTLEKVDGTQSFVADDWERSGGGGGRSCVLSDGRVIEKAGVNVSCVFGEMSPEFAGKIPGAGQAFFAAGISLIIHPRNPHAPTVHANFRYLEKGEGAERRAWFGGGADLTPWILYEEDARHFHGAWRDVCARHPVVRHEVLKKWCDEYFFLPHRGETRGIGGIFFDYLGLEDHERGTAAEPEHGFSFVQDAGRAFLGSYVPILERRRGAESTEDEREWQLHRRGRYVEFNLIHDRGTAFGLMTGGRVESILVSLPNLVRWTYQYQAPATVPSEPLLEVLRSPRDWLAP